MSFSSKILAAARAAVVYDNAAMADRMLHKELEARGLTPKCVINDARAALRQERRKQAQLFVPTGPSQKMGRTWTY